MQDIFLRGLYKNIKNLTQEQIDNIMFPEVLLPLQHELKSWNDKVYHFHPRFMLRLAKLGVIPLNFLYLNYDVPLFASCIFGTERRRQWISKGEK